MTQERPRILVAEDEAVIRLDLVETLREEGYPVIGHTGNGLTAVELITDMHPDVALVDIAMPGLDGIEIARRVSDMTAVVVVTAFAQRERVTQARDAGAMSYLVKPVGRDDLVPAIEMAWSGWLTLRDLRGQAVESAAAAARVEQRLADRRDVERAKGRVRDHLGLSEDDAYRWLRQTAMDRRVSLAELARNLLEPDGSGTDQAPRISPEDNE
ncbi:MAG: response regulator [Candidatus Nanopelagicales bacterium]